MSLWPLAILAFGGAQGNLAGQLRALPGVAEVTSSNGTFDLAFEQPVDHKAPRGAKFRQHVFVRHSGFDKPVILGTEGYAARGARGGELATMLGEPNVIAVEHRYFGRSVPSPIDWKQLTVRNAADDMHRIVTALKTLYRGKWVATGASKGGQTALFYKCFYPNDVDATVAYVAPVNVGQEDPRINHFIETVGDQATREKIRAFQIAMLKREDEILPLLNLSARNFSMGVAKAYEYAVLEYPYAFWQYGSKPETIPTPNAPAKEMIAHFNAVDMLRYYSDSGKKPFEPFMYQAFTEIGYYNYDITNFKPYLKHNPNPTNMDLCPPGTQSAIVFNPQTMAFVFNFLQYKADRVAYIYGETDAWSATQMQLIGRTDAIKLVARNASHNASVRAMSPEQKETFYAAMERWLGMKLNRL
ncbi:peptidase [bacterium]|nr:MAG: peptidase [bacterium]